MVSKDIPSLLRGFSRAATRLNAESDSANATLSAIEEELVEANVGIEVWLRRGLLSTDAERSTAGETIQTAHWLGFAKVEGEWCLAIKLMRFVSGFFEGDSSCPYQDEFGAGDPVRLLRSSRQLRIAALEVLPELIELLTAEAQRCAQTITDAKQLLVNP
jgi:hypothetical protein